MRLLAPLILLLLPAASANAQSDLGFDFQGATITLSYNDYDNPDENSHPDDNTTNIVAATRYKILPQVELAFTLGYNQEQFGGDPHSIQLFYEVNPRYVTDNGQIGVFHAILEEASVNGDFDQEQFGVAGAQNFGNVTFEGYASRLDEGPTEYNAVGIALAYNFNDHFSAYYTERRDYDANGSIYDGLATIGVQYDLAGIWENNPLTLDGQYSRFFSEETSVGSSDFSGVSFLISYKFGEGADSLFHGVRSTDLFYD